MNTMKTKQLLLSAALGLASSLAFASQIVTQWNFQDSSGGTSTANIGTGTITPIGDVTHSGFNSGSGSSDPIQPGSGFQTTSYPSQSTASGTAGIRVDVPTLGFASPAFSSLEVSFDLRTSNTASRWYRLDYTTDGTNWNLGTPSRLGAAANAGDSWHNNNTVQINDLAALNNNNFGFRVVSVFSPDAFTEANSSTNFAANTA